MPRTNGSCNEASARWLNPPLRCRPRSLAGRSRAGRVVPKQLKGAGPHGLRSAVRTKTVPALKAPRQYLVGRDPFDLYCSKTRSRSAGRRGCSAPARSSRAVRVTPHRMRLSRWRAENLMVWVLLLGCKSRGRAAPGPRLERTGSRTALVAGSSRTLRNEACAGASGISSEPEKPAASIFACRGNIRGRRDSGRSRPSDTARGRRARCRSVPDRVFPVCPCLSTDFSNFGSAMSLK